MYFDDKGRCIPNYTKFPVNKKSRYYFSLDENIKQKIDLNKIYSNYQNFYGTKLNINQDEFIEKIKEIQKKINLDDKIKNINEGVGFPFIIPKLSSADIGSNIKNIFLPALKKSYKNKFQNYEFINHIKFDLSNKLDIRKESRYENIISKSLNEEIVGILYPCLNEYSFPAAYEVLKNLPEKFVLSGGYEIISALIGTPEMLFDKDKYTPLLWFSSMKNFDDENISYHIEPYGYNITLNERAHLNQAAEYWWHSLSILE